MLNGARSMVLLVAMAFCVIGLLALAATIFFPGPGRRARRRRRDRNSVPNLDIERRLRPYGSDKTVIDLVGAEAGSSAPGTGTTAKKTSAVKKTSEAKK